MPPQARRVWPTLESGQMAGKDGGKWAQLGPFQIPAPPHVSQGRVQRVVALRLRAGVWNSLGLAGRAVGPVIVFSEVFGRPRFGFLDLSFRLHGSRVEKSFVRCFSRSDSNHRKFAARQYRLRNTQALGCLHSPARDRDALRDRMEIDRCAATDMPSPPRISVPEAGVRSLFDLDQVDNDRSQGAPLRFHVWRILSRAVLLFPTREDRSRFLWLQTIGIMPAVLPRSYRCSEDCPAACRAKNQWPSLMVRFGHDFFHKIHLNLLDLQELLPLVFQEHVEFLV